MDRRRRVLYVRDDRQPKGCLIYSPLARAAQLRVVFAGHIRILSARYGDADRPDVSCKWLGHTLGRVYGRIEDRVHGPAAPTTGHRRAYRAGTPDLRFRRANHLDGAIRVPAESSVRHLESHTRVCWRVGAAEAIRRGVCEEIWHSVPAPLGHDGNHASRYCHDPES